MWACSKHVMWVSLVPLLQLYVGVAGAVRYHACIPSFQLAHGASRSCGVSAKHVVTVRTSPGEATARVGFEAASQRVGVGCFLRQAVITNVEAGRDSALGGWRRGWLVGLLAGWL